jgi:energy-coupling factor transporter ATP-binding protein EcfA2
MTTHRLARLVKQVNKTHRGLGPLIAINLVAAKARKCILNVAPAGCGKSTATDTVAYILRDKAKRYTSITLAGLIRVAEEFTDYGGHIIIDDLGAEKSEWSRTATIEVLSHLVYSHHVDKITQTSRITITGFYGSAALNIQPIMMNSLVQADSWVALVRDKVIRYYHLIRPKQPKKSIPAISLEWGPPISQVAPPKYKGRLWYQLIAIGLVQWSYARCLEHIPDMLRACAALDGRDRVSLTDYKLLIKLMKPMQLERYIVSSYSLETGRTFQNDLYCLLVELASFGQPSLDTIAEDYKVSPMTVRRIAKEYPEWCWLKSNSPTRLVPTEWTQKVFKICGVNQRW